MYPIAGHHGPNPPPQEIATNSVAPSYDFLSVLAEITATDGSALGESVRLPPPRDVHVAWPCVQTKH